MAKDQRWTQSMARATHRFRPNSVKTCKYLTNPFKYQSEIYPQYLTSPLEIRHKVQ